MSSLRVLVVEDEAIVAMEISHRLKGLGHEVVATTGEGEVAVEAAVKLLPDIILMDIQLAGNLDGIEAAELILRQHAVPIVFLTAHADPATLARARVTEPYGYILKPFDERELHVILAMAHYKFHAENRIRQSQRHLEAVFRGIADSVITFDCRGNVTFLNHAAELMIGFVLDDAIERPLSDLFTLYRGKTRVPIGMMADPFAQSSDKVNERLELQIGRRRFPIEGSISPITDHDGHRIGAVLVMRDISERLRVEQQLQESQRIEAVGRLAGGMAHDYNNLLSVILGYTMILVDETPQGHTRHRCLGPIQDATEKAAELTQQLLAYSQKLMISPRPIDLGEVLERCHPMMQAAFASDVRLEVDPPRSDSMVFLDARIFEGVLVQLVEHAGRSLTDGGQVTISCEKLLVNNELEGLPNHVPPGDYQVLTIKDTGIGIPDSKIAELFEPFSISGSSDVPTGLSLSAVYGFVRQSKGYIRVVSYPGSGTSTSLYFPTYHGTEVHGESNTSSDLGANAKTILVVEDDSTLGMMLRRTLQEAGYRVLLASSGEMARTMLEQHPGPIDALIIETLLEGKNGWELARRLEWIRPNIKVLLLSETGSTERPIPTSTQRGWNCIGKPFSLSRLVSTVRNSMVEVDPALENDS